MSTRCTVTPGGEMKDAFIFLKGAIKAAIEEIQSGLRAAEEAESRGERDAAEAHLVQAMKAELRLAGLGYSVGNLHVSSQIW